MTVGEPEYQIPPNVLFREVDGQLVLLNLETEQYFGLDEIGADMIRRITETTMDDAIAALTSSYDVDPDRLRADLRELVDSLLEAQLLDRDGTG
jgi:hypothetical protein